MMDKKAHLNSTMLNISTDPPQSESLISSVKDTLYKKMCAKLAVISIDIVKNLSISNHVLAQSQQSDDYLSVIRENISLPENPFPKFRIINQVLYKEIHEPKYGSHKYVICLPDILMPSVAHSLHLNLGHASVKTTQRNFEYYYYHRNSTRLIKSCIRSCTTCKNASDHDLKRVIPKTCLDEIKKHPMEEPPFPPKEILEDIGLEALFNPPQEPMHLLPPPEPPDINTPFVRRKSPRGYKTHSATNSILQNIAYTSDESEYYSDNSDSNSEYSDPNQTNFNTLNVELDMSQSYRATLVSKRSRSPSVTFLVTPIK
jgi:hypothetical protein